MTIGEKLKQWRAESGLGQKEAASLLGVKPSSYQKYEMDISAPGAEAMEAFVRAGINANWLLTGEGEMLRPRTALGVALAEGRGSRSVEEMAARLGVPADQLQRYEQGLDRPDEAFLKRFLAIAEGDPVKLAAKLDFGVGMAGIVDDLKEAASKASPGRAAFESAMNAPINVFLLTEVIRGVEDYLAGARLQLPSDKKGELIALLYEHFLGKGAADRDTVARFVKLCT